MPTNGSPDWDVSVLMAESDGPLVMSKQSFVISLLLILIMLQIKKRQVESGTTKTSEGVF